MPILPIWFASVRGTFSPSDLVAGLTNSDIGDKFSITHPEAIKYFESARMRTKSDKGSKFTIASSKTHRGGLFSPNSNPHDQQFLFGLYKNSALVKGLQFNVVNGSTLILAQTSGSAKSCKSRLTWSLDICDGCCCRMGDQSGLVKGQVMHKVLPNVHNKAGKCRKWFLKVDATFRGFLAGVRSQLLSMKTACCSPGDFDNGIHKQRWVVCRNQQFSDFGAGCMPRKTEKQRNLKRGKKKPVEDSNAKYDDHTAKWIGKLYANCSEYVLLRKDVLDSPYWGGLPYPKTQRNWEKLVSPRHLSRFSSLADRIVCAEKSTTDEQRLSFSPHMGDRFFPPHVTEHPHSQRKTHSVRLSCGGRKYLSVYTASNEFCLRSSPGEHGLNTIQRRYPTDIMGNSVAGTVGCAQADGGEIGCDTQVKMDNKKGTEWGNKLSQKMATANTGRSVRCKKRFRPNLSDVSNTCCPPPFFDSPGIGNHGLASPSGRLRVQKSVKACRSSQFGTTSKCETDFKMKILVCKTCQCHELVRVETSHRLLSKDSGCKPWFVLSDSGIRTMVSHLREKVMGNKLRSAECKRENRKTRGRPRGLRY